jgi:hypothetical protein
MISGTWRSRAHTAALAAAALTLVGCSSSDDTTTPPSSAPTATSSTSTSASPSPTAHGSDHADPPAPKTSAPLVTTEATDKAARERGVTVMRLFARRNVSAEKWLSDLRPYLTAQAAEDYSYTDPRNVPPTKVTGPGKVIGTDSEYLVYVHVPTDAGLYAVLMSRSETDHEWKAERITPPEPDPH